MSHEHHSDDDISTTLLPHTAKLSKSEKFTLNGVPLRRKDERELITRDSNHEDIIDAFEENDDESRADLVQSGASLASSVPLGRSSTQQYQPLDVDDSQRDQNWHENDSARESSFHEPQYCALHSLPNNFPPFFPLMYMDLVHEPINNFTRVYMTLGVTSLVLNFSWNLVGIVLSNVQLAILGATHAPITTALVLYYAAAFLLSLPLKPINFAALYHSGRMRNSLRDWFAIISQSITVLGLFAQVLLEISFGVYTTVFPPPTNTQRVLLTMIRVVLLLGAMALFLFECVILGMIVQKHRDNYGTLKRAWNAFYEEYLDGFWESILLI